MRILNSTAFWGILIASAFIFAMSMQPSYAASYSDQCSNLRGMQVMATNGDDWRFKVRTPEKGDCRIIPRSA